MKSLLSLLTLVALASGNLSSAEAQDNHLHIGATGAAQLNFIEAADFSTDANYVNTLIYTNAGPYSGHFVGNITFAALATSDPGAAAPGSVIYARLVSVDGPAEGVFSFWDRGATSPSVSLAAGAMGTNVWRISENDGSPGSNPFGHIHGRRFTATKPGIYAVTFKALDFSTNGFNGAPINSPSEALKIYFQAGINIKSVVPGSDGVHVTFGGPFGFNWQLEANSDLSSVTNWNAVGDPTSGNDSLAEVIDPRPVGTNRFYRVRLVP